MQTNLNFNTDAFFVGGAGMFIEFHDVVKPVYLYAVLSALISEDDYGLPMDLLRDYSIVSLVEWYQNRKYINPLCQLDWQHKIQKEILDRLLSIMLEDDSIYRLAPLLNIGAFLDIYRGQHMNFPWFIYSEKYEPGIKSTCDDVFTGIPYKYLHGDLLSALKNCNQNYTYIFSDIEKAKSATELLHGSYANVLLASDYRYNYKNDCKTLLYDLNILMDEHPFVRLGTTTVMDISLMTDSFNNIISEERKEEE